MRFFGEKDPHDWEVIERFNQNDIDREAYKVAFPHEDPYKRLLRMDLTDDGWKIVAVDKVCIRCEVVQYESGPLIGKKAREIMEETRRLEARKARAKEIWQNKRGEE